MFTCGKHRQHRAPLGHHMHPQHSSPGHLTPHMPMLHTAMAAIQTMDHCKKWIVPAWNDQVGQVERLWVPGGVRWAPQVDQWTNQVGREAQVQGEVT